MDWLLCENILMHNWNSVLEGGCRPPMSGCTTR